MLRLISSWLGQRVMTTQSPEPLGVIRDYVLDPDKGLIVAYAVKVGRQTKYLSTIDITKHFDDAVLVRDVGVLQNLDELVRIKHLIHTPAKLLGTKVVDEKGSKLGSVKDALFDTMDHRLARLYVKPTMLEKLFTEERIIGREQIIQIEAKRVVVRANTTTQVPEAQAEIAP